MDDILVTGETKDEHLRNLEQVLTRLENANIQLKRNKCEFMLPAVEYLGHRISALGLQPTQEKTEAIRNAPVLTIMYYISLFPASNTHPLSNWIANLSVW